MNEEKKQNIPEENQDENQTIILPAAGEISSSTENSAKSSLPAENKPIRASRTAPPVRGGRHIRKKGINEKKKQNIPIGNHDENQTIILPAAGEILSSAENLAKSSLPAQNKPIRASRTAPPVRGGRHAKKKEQTLNGVKRNKYADKMNPKRKKKNSKKKAIIISAVLALVLILALAVFFAYRYQKANNIDLTNQTAFAYYGMVENFIEGQGTTAAKNREELGKDVKGTVKKVYVEIGDEVKKGDKLMDIDPTETKKELEAAKEEVAAAQTAVNEAKNNVKLAQDALKSIENTVGEFSIKAPFSGKIIPLTDEGGNAISFPVGTQINQGDTIGYMVDDNIMKLSLYFSYAYKDAIKTGQTATISIPSAMSSINGSVSSIDDIQKISDDGVKLFRVNITVNNPGTLAKGMVATATVSSSSGEVYPADSGTLTYNREEAISAGKSGIISKNNGTDYYQYSSGATIVTAKNSGNSAELQNAKNNVTAAESAKSAADKLLTSKKSVVTSLEKVIKDSGLKATMSGTIVNVTAEAGMDVTGGTLCVIADLSAMVVNAYITATDVSAVQPGQMATMTVYTQEGQSMLTGVVQSVSMEADKELGSGQGGMPIFPAVIELDSFDSDINILPDCYIDYQIITNSVSDCLVIPSSAIVNTEEGTAVFAREIEGEEFGYTIPIPEGTEGIPAGFVLVPVEVGIADSSNTEIIYGIDEGTEVYLAGPEDLYASFDDGMGMDTGAIAVG